MSDPAVSYAAARRGVALARRGERALVQVGGDDRARFLQGLLSNDVTGLQSGSGCRALFLDNKGHVRAVLDLWAGDDAIVIGSEPRFIDEVLPDLTRYILAADVTVTDLRADKAVLALLGPEADAVLGRAGAAAPAAGLYAHCGATIGGVAVRLARTPELAAPGVELHVPVDGVEGVWSTLQQAAGPEPVSFAEGAAEALRVEAGLARMGREITGDEFPQELRLDDAINYEKGCYLGQETVARIHYRGQVNRLLSGLRAERPLPAGAELVSSGRRVGTITSAAESPALGSIALAMVRREESEAGATVEVSADDAILGDARVVSLPIGA
ncbi:MAG: glycine cleavage T C-terminal barrel domain-containing protein [Acidobacteriota bacterium]|jgi:aminomethyltransferase